MTSNTANALRNRGFSLIEVLVALLISAIGILGMLALQARTQEGQLETFQRTQAFSLVEEMANRIMANESARRCYAITDGTGGPGAPFVGIGNSTTYTCGAFGTPGAQDIADADLQDWDALLKGASETLEIAGTQENVGGLLGARGCVVYTPVAGTEDEIFTISVAWSSPREKGSVASANDCGKGDGSFYGTDSQRRVVSIVLEVTDKTPG